LAYLAHTALIKQVTQFYQIDHPVFWPDGKDSPVFADYPARFLLKRLRDPFVASKKLLFIKIVKCEPEFFLINTDFVVAVSL